MNILLIENDTRLSDVVGEQLKAAGYRVENCYSGGDAQYYLSNNVYDVIILDRMLPQVDGLTLLHEFRKRGDHTPVILLTGMNGLNDKVEGLYSEADDYLVKPFEMEELLAQIHALLRHPKKMEEPEELSYGDICLRVKERKLRRQDSQDEIRLSRREASLMEYFMINAKQVITRNQILSRVWENNAFVEDGNIDNYIHIMRKRLKAVESSVVIKTVYGIGYQMLYI